MRSQNVRQNTVHRHQRRFTAIRPRGKIDFTCEIPEYCTCIPTPKYTYVTDHDVCRRLRQLAKRPSDKGAQYEPSMGSTPQVSGPPRCMRTWTTCGLPVVPGTLEVWNRTAGQARPWPCGLGVGSAPKPVLPVAS